MLINKIEMDDKGKWDHNYDRAGADMAGPKPGAPTVPPLDMATTPVEVRAVSRRQLFIDGKPVGEVFE